MLKKVLRPGVLLMVIILFIPLCSAMAVVPTGEPTFILLASLDKQSNYHSGEYINLSIFSYLGDAPADLDFIYVNFTDIYGQNSKPVEVQKSSAGTYHATYLLKDDDIEKRFVVTGMLANRTKVVYVSIPFDTPASLLLSIQNLNSTLVEPGERVRFNVSCFYGNNPEMPSSTRVSLIYNGIENILNISNVSEGVFAGEFIIPAVSNLTVFALRAEAIIQGMLEASEIHLYYFPYSIWYHPYRITESTASFDIGICNKSGAGLANQTVHLNYTTEFMGTTRSVASTTNSDGIAHFYIAPDVIFSNYLYIYGSVNISAISGKFEFVIPFSRTGLQQGFDVSVNEAEYRDKELSLKGTAYNSSIPLSHTHIQYFLKNFGGMHGRFYTDANGSFSLNVTLDERYIHPLYGVTFMFAIENESAICEKVVVPAIPVDLWLDHDLSLSVDNFSYGKIVNMHLRTNHTFLTSMYAMPTLAIYDGTAADTTDLNQPWVPIAAPIEFIPENETSMLCTLPVPEFAYTGASAVTIMAGYYEQNTFVPHMCTVIINLNQSVQIKLGVVYSGEDYITIAWNKYNGTDFVKYEIFIEESNSTSQKISVANITDVNITKYTITNLRGDTHYNITLRLYFGNLFVEQTVGASTRNKIPGFTLAEAVILLVIIALATTILRQHKKRR